MNLYQPEVVFPQSIIKQFQGINKNCFVIQISPSEYKICEECSKNFWSNSKGGVYGKGICNNSKDPYKATRVGKLGEMAFGKVFNLPVDIGYKEGGDKYDFRLGSYVIDLKTRTHLNYVNGLIYHVNERGRVLPIDKDIYCFGYLDSEDRTEQTATVVLVGYLIKEDLRKCPIKSGYGGGKHKNFEVRYSITQSIQVLYDYKQEYFG